MDETESGPCCISFSGAGGYVTVTVSEKTNQREVDVETREFEYQAKKVLGLSEESACLSEATYLGQYQILPE